MAQPQPMNVPVKIVAELPWAWAHQCGHLQRGAYTEGATCTGCRFVTKLPEVEQYLLVSTVAVQS